jgi:hypothetical protein
MAIAARLCVLTTAKKIGSADGPLQRYCRTCSKWQPLAEFSGAKRTCAKQLEAHAARRREKILNPQQAEQRAAVSPSPSGGGSADFPAAAAPEVAAVPASRQSARQSARRAAPAEASAAAAAAPPDEVAYLFQQWAREGDVDSDLVASLIATAADNAALPPIDPDSARNAAAMACAGSWPMLSAGVPLGSWPPAGLYAPTALMPPMPHPAYAPAPDSSFVTLKFQNAVPTDFPPSLAPALAGWFPQQLLSLDGHIQPGCSLLTLHALREGAAPAGDASSMPEAEALAAHLAASDAGPWLRMQARVTLRVGGTGAPVLLRYGMVDDGAHADTAPDAPRLPRVGPAAVTGCAKRTSLRLEAPAGSAPLLCMLNGRTLLHTASTGTTIALPPSGEEGVLLVARALADAATPPRPVLLVRDAAIAAELAASMPGGAANAADDAALAAVGAALRPGAQPAVLRAAAAEALRHGWAATSARLLPALRTALTSRSEAQAADKDADEAIRRQALLSLAVCGLAPGRTVPTVLREGGPACVFGAPERPAPGAAEATPLHLAAMLADGTAAAALCAHSRAAALAWFAVGATCADGVRRTPAALACASAAAGSFTPAHAHAKLVARLQREVRSARAADDAVLYAAYLRDSVEAGRAHALVLVPSMMSWELLALMTRLKPMSDARIADIVAQPVWKDAIQAFTGTAPEITAVLRICSMVALSACALMPRMHRFYVRHHNALLLAFAGSAMVFSPAITEWRFRQQYGLLLWPFAGQIFEIVCTLTLAAGVPLRLSCHLLLLSARLALYLVANLLPAASAPAVWPRTSMIREGVALNLIVNAACMLALAEVDTRAFARWRAAKRRKADKVEKAE